MKTPNLLGTLLALTAPLLLSACNESIIASKAAQNVPVSFRIVGDGTLDSTELVQIRSYVGEAANRIRLDSLVRRWQDKQVALQVPLGQPLEFRFDGLNRRNDRLVSFWSAVGFDTLRGGDRSANVVALQFMRNDVTPPSTSVLAPPSGSQIVLRDDTLFVSLPPGLGSGIISLPASLDSVYLAGKALAEGVSGGWEIPATRGQDLSLTVVNPNGTSSVWTVAVRSGDITGPAFVLGLNAGATQSVKADTTVFTLPYVVAESPVLTVANADAKDVLKSLDLGKDALDVGKDSWTIPVSIPVAGDSSGIRYALTGRDSLGNAATRFVRIVRAFSAKVPRLEWLVPPATVSWGTQTVNYKLKVSGGDSMLVPEVLTRGLNNPQAPVVDTSYGDATVWKISLNLLEKDSGAIWVKASNLSGSSWSLDTVSLKRFDPMGPDQIPPVLTITSPTNAAWTRSVASSLAGRAWDERKGRVTVVVERGGKIDTAAWQASDSSWNWPLTWNGDGDSVVRIRATDSVGNRSKDTIWTLRRDTRKPSLAWAGTARHGDTLWTNADSIPLVFTLSDFGNGKLRELSVYRLGASDSLHLTSSTGGLWSFKASVKGIQGVSAWAATGVDSAGNDTTLAFHVLRDTVKPVLTVTSARSVSGIAGTTTNVSATASDEHVLESLSIAGTPGTSPYSKAIVFPAAGTSSTVLVQATDAVSNISTDSVILTGIVQSPIQSAGVKPGTTGREFFFQARCPDSNATLQDSASAWGTWDGPIFVGDTLEKTLRCHANGTASPVARFAWLPKDTAYALPVPIADRTIPDTAYAMGTDTAGTTWIVSTLGSAWYWPKGDSTWHVTTSPFSSNQGIRIIPSTVAGSLWFMVRDISPRKLWLARTGSLGVAIVPGAPIALDTLPAGPIKAWVGEASLALAYPLGSYAAIELRPVGNLSSKNTFYLATFAIDGVNAIVENSLNSFTMVGGSGGGTCAASVSIAAVSSPEPAKCEALTGLAKASYPLTFSRAGDGSLILTNMEVVANPRGASYTSYVHRFAPGMPPSIPTTYSTVGGMVSSVAADGGSSHLWLGINNPTSSQPIANFKASDLALSPFPNLANQEGPIHLTATPSGSALAVMSLQGETSLQLHRFFRR